MGVLGGLGVGRVGVLGEVGVGRVGVLGGAAWRHGARLSCGRGIPPSAGNPSGGRGQYWGAGRPGRAGTVG